MQGPDQIGADIGGRRLARQVEDAVHQVPGLVVGGVAAQEAQHEAAAGFDEMLVQLLLAIDELGIDFFLLQLLFLQPFEIVAEASMSSARRSA